MNFCHCWIEAEVQTACYSYLHSRTTLWQQQEKLVRPELTYVNRKKTSLTLLVQSVSIWARPTLASAYGRMTVSKLLPFVQESSQFCINLMSALFGQNDQGNRTTPSYVAFTDSERLIDDAAKNQTAMNPHNTVFVRFCISVVAYALTHDQFAYRTPSD